MSAETKPVDVLACMDHAASFFASNGYPATAKEMRKARAAMDELIEAAAEFRKGAECHIFQCVYCGKRSRRIDADLDRIGGAA